MLSIRAFITQEFLSNARMTVNGHGDAFKLSTSTWMRLLHTLEVYVWPPTTPSRKERKEDRNLHIIIVGASRSITHFVVHLAHLSGWRGQFYCLGSTKHHSQQQFSQKGLSEWIRSILMIIIYFILNPFTVEFSKLTFWSYFCNFCDVSLVKIESKSNF